jgi:23S rRNA (uracil1939-C5)-methyltransferase
VQAGRSFPREFISRHDRESPCPRMPSCVGCPLIGLPYPNQLKKKREKLVQALGAYLSLSKVNVPDVVPSPHRFGYRGRVKLVVRKSRRRIAAGLYVPGTHRVLDVSSCPVHPKPVNQAVAIIKKKCLELGIEPYDERNDTGQLRYLDFRYGFTRKEMSVTLVTRRREFPQGRDLARSLKRRFSFVKAVIQNVNEQRGNVIWGEKSLLLQGEDLIVENVGPFKLGFPSVVFFQANPAAAAMIYEEVLDLAGLSGKETVIDLYCGVGPISLHLASNARAVWGVDDNEPSISAAKQNARRNGIGNCRFLAGDVGDQLSEIKRTLGRIDLVTLNPPRKGVQPRAMDALLAADAARIIYVSCDPITMARDLNRLTDHGYAVSQIEPFDMFPQTEEVETVAALERIPHPNPLREEREG